jgi:DNA-binding NarL/FixJ family response regulator
LTIRVVVADDQPLIRAGLGALLAAQPGIEVLAEAAGAEALRAAAATYLPDIVIMELLLPGCDDGNLIGKLVADGCRVLAMTSDRNPRHAFAALRSGASGFLLKSSPPEALIVAVRAIAVAGTWLETTVVDAMLAELASGPATGENVAGHVRLLTAREREVLVLLANGMGNLEIAGRLYLSEATVRTHIGRILMKLHCRDRTRAVVVAYRSGLVRVTAGEAGRA